MCAAGKVPFISPGQGGHCFGGNKLNDSSRTFKRPHNLFTNLFDHSFKHVKQLYSIKSLSNNADVHYIVYSSPTTAPSLHNEDY